jgi:diguanylate cyclase (GGDEF)-like protein
MNINKGSLDTRVQEQHKMPDQQDNTLFADTGNRPPDADVTIEDAMSNREESVTAREEVTLSREETADQRESVAQARERAVHLREDVSSSLEKIAHRAQVTRADLENHIDKLREANEHLVISTVKAQIMTEEVQKTKDQMEHMVHHDCLTDLPNRVLLMERLMQALALAKRHVTKLAVLFIDLDRFKTINDSLGHAIGDALLQSVAQRLSASIRSSDTVSRQGGDEFVVLLSEVTDDNAVSAFTDKIIKSVSAPYTLAEQTLHIGVTIGISVYPDDGEDAETLIRNADVAMYHAKNSGRNRYHFFRAEMNDRVVERQQIEGDLYRALDQKEFELYYQAQVELDTGSIIGVEALIRWHHPVRGLLLPAVSVPIAETCGAIVPIGRWVLRQACWQAQAWLDADLDLHVVAVNISAMEFDKDDFLGNLLAVLRDTRLAPQHLELELTETVLMKNAESTMAMLQKLKSMGVRISIDDFGTGYSSLSYLKKFPVDTLKIDQSFVSTLSSNDNDGILVDSVISLGKSLQYCVIAEGVETREQLAFLSDRHCGAGQGYYLSPPLAAEEFAALLKSGISKNLSHRNLRLH